VQGGEACTAAADQGPCRAAIQMYHYNAESGQCEEFYYGGCAGNANRYETIEQCQQTCSGASVLKRQRNNKT